jgi:hypothetical protein
VSARRSAAGSAQASVSGDLSRVVHVHSTYSDGTATVPEIAAAARRAGAGAVLITDHDTLAARCEEGVHDGVLVLAGVEISAGSAHLLAFDLQDVPRPDGDDPREVCRAVAAAGGFGVAAHPFSAGSRMLPLVAPPHPWPALEDGCCDGLELWSLVTDTAEGWRTPAEAIRVLRAPEAGPDGPPAHHLAAWDRLCARRRMAAVGGLDAHQSGLRIGRRVLSPMPHDRWFRLLRRPADVTLRRDGERLDTTASAREVECGVDAPGAYRAECFVDGRLWPLSNPVYLR